jgi:hypothetical protein
LFSCLKEIEREREREREREEERETEIFHKRVGKKDLEGEFGQHVLADRDSECSL